VESHRADTRKEIEDVFKVVFDNRASILQKNNMTGDINDNVLALLNDMERDMMRKQDSAEATKINKDLAKRLSQVEESLKTGETGSVAPADIQRWNKAASKSQSLEESFDKLKAHIESLNLEQTRVDIQKTNSLVLTMTPRADFDPLARELQKNKNQISDLHYEIQILAKKLDSTNIELKSSRSNAKQELG
jgi:chromosome segregation ATPase